MMPLQYREEAMRIIALLKREFVMADGSLFLEKNGDAVRAFHIFPDFGDMAPFFLYFGEEEFVAGQAARYRASLKGGLLVSQFPSLGIPGLVKSYEYTDLLLGLLAYLEAAPEDAERKRLLEEAVRAVRRCFLRGGALRSLYHPGLAFALPVIDTRDATLIECFTDLHQFTKDEGYLDDAQAVFGALLRTPFYKKYGLFADYEPAGPISALLLKRSGKSAQATLCKNTTNALFAFLALHTARPDSGAQAEIERILDAIDAHATTADGAIIERFVPGRAPEEGYLTASFPVLDFLCDLAFAVPSLRERSLRKARSIADYWLARQGATGLFPLRGGGRGSFFDSETDMTVALTKLSEVSGDRKYEDAAERCLRGIITHHGKLDYPLSVDIDTGAALETAQRTKFLCLFLKVLILKIEQGEEHTIFGTPALFNLLKDR